MTLTLARESCRSSGALTGRADTEVMTSRRPLGEPVTSLHDAAPATTSTRSTAPTCAPGWPRRSTRSWSPSGPTLDGISEDIAPIAEAIAEFVDGGKRLRPAFCYWGWRAAGGADCDEIIAAAAALELLQACALVHDDVMDGSDRRRGAPSVHRKFGSLHRVAGWHGNPESFGVAAAILLGDLCLVWSEQMLNTSGLDHDGAAARPAGARPDAGRADDRPVPRRRRAGHGRRLRRARAAGRPVQGREVHDRGPAADRRGARRRLPDGLERR